jgi:hypothetical protein
MNKTRPVGEASFAREFQHSDLWYFGVLGVPNLQSSERRDSGTSEVATFVIGAHR